MERDGTDVVGGLSVKLVREGKGREGNVGGGGSMDLEEACWTKPWRGT